MSNPVSIEKVGNGLYSFLTADSLFNTEIGGSASAAGRLRAGIAEDNISTPYAVYSFVSDVFWDTFAQEGAQIRVQISCYRDQEDGSNEIAKLGDMLRDRLHRADLTISGHEPLTVEFDIARGPFREDELWRYDFDFVIRVFRT